MRRLVRGHGEARWLPSRFYFSLFRLAGYLRVRFGRREPRPELTLVMARGQTAVENYTVAVWVMLTLACFVFFELARVMAWPLALALSVPLGSIALQAPICTTGAIFVPLWARLTRTPAAYSMKLNAIVTIMFCVLAAAHYTRAQTWVRFAAWQFLGIVSLNALAAVILFALRADVARLEATYGGAASDV